jgi:transcriptional regulator with XRE-family HTH domain
METLAEYLGRVMRQKNLDPAELAKRCDLTASYIGRLRKGTVGNPTVKTIVELAKALEVNAHEIFAAASGIPASEAAHLGPLLFLDQMQKLLSDSTGIEVLQQWLQLSSGKRKKLLDYCEHFKRQPPKGKSRKK